MKHSPDYAGLATAVHTVPALAAVGLTEAAAKAKGLSPEVHVNDMHHWFQRGPTPKQSLGRRSSSIVAATVFSVPISSATPVTNS